MAKYLLKFTAFLIALFIALAIILVFDLVLIRLLIERVASPETLLKYKPHISLAGVIVWLLSINLLFRKIVLRKSVKRQSIALVFFLLCQTLGLGFTLINQADLASITGMVGFMGLGAYYLIIPFKKPLIPQK